MALTGNISARRTPMRKWIMLGIMLLLLAVAAYVVYYFTLNKSLPLPSAELTAGEVLAPPQYMYSISGTGTNGLGRPTGVALGKDGRVYVSDVTRARISVFSHDGRYLSSFDGIKDGKNTKLKDPVHVAFDVNDQLYVTDRILDGVYVFDTEGKFIRKFMPKDLTLTKNWSPLALTWGPDGRFYLSDVGNTDKHQMFVFAPDGTKALQWGKTTQVDQSSASPGDFYFPNGIGVSKTGLIFVADGNNRRVQVFDKDGKFVQFIASSGIPRGVWVDDANKRVIVSDALAHQVDIYSFKGEKLVSFGEGGNAAGQFQFPNDVAVDSDGRIFIADRENHQVQVWGWPKAALPVSVADVAQRWYWCLTPLLLLPLLLLLRKREFVLTPDFVDGMVATEDVDLMQHRKLRWVSPETEHASHFAGRTEGGIDLGQLIEPTVHSESDAKELMDRLSIDMPTAILLSMAKRCGRLATEDGQLSKLANMLDVEVYDCDAFRERFPRKKA